MAHMGILACSNHGQPRLNAQERLHFLLIHIIYSLFRDAIGYLMTMCFEHAETAGPYHAYDAETMCLSAVSKIS